jgi:hypothetical protein
MRRRSAFTRVPFDEALTLELAVSRYAPDSGFAASELTELADARALPGPVEVDGRCFVTEAREELADARSYLVWEHYQRRADGGADDGPDLQLLELALAALATAWQHLSLLDDADHGSVGDVEQRRERLPLPAATDADHPRAIPGTSRGARADRRTQ